MENEKNTAEATLTPEQEKAVADHQTNMTAYAVVTLFGVLMCTVLIPNFVRLKNNVDFGPEKFPYIIGGLFILLGVVGIVLEMGAIRKSGLRVPMPRYNLKQYIPQVVMLASGFAFVALATTLGFIPAAVVCTVFWLWLFGSRKLTFNVVWAVVYVMLLFLLFSRLLGIRFTGGIFQL